MKISNVNLIHFKRKYKFYCDVLQSVTSLNIFFSFFSDSLSYLNQYETDRQRHNVPTMLAIDGLQKLYNTEFTPIVILRSLGLQVTHALMPLKVIILSYL